MNAVGFFIDQEIYSYTGQIDSLEEVVRGYMRNSNLAHQGNLRNGDPELSKIALIEEDLTSLIAFLRSLNEDYE